MRTSTRAFCIAPTALLLPLLLLLLTSAPGFASAKSLPTWQCWQAAAQHLYYGFFPNRTAADSLKSTAAKILTNAFEVGPIRDEYASATNHSADSNVSRLVDFAYTNPTVELHVTSKFCNFSCPDYALSQAVLSALGSKFLLNATHLLLTPRTFGFRVRVPSDALAVWAQPDEPVPGARAHFTISTSPGVPAVQTGLDLLSVLDRVGTNLNATVEQVSGVVDFGDGQFLLELGVGLPVVAEFRGSDKAAAPAAAFAWQFWAACVLVQRLLRYWL